jgi:hypothetical protein
LTVATAPERTQSRWATDPEYREFIRRKAREAREAVGLVGELTMTPKEIQAMFLARGVRPEDNVASRELMRMRYGEDWEPTEEGE